ncbi:MAG TPA: hypothetical protein VGF76_20655 [Polyangiaceae bacterium]
MKLSLYSLSIGVSILGSIACGNSTNQSKVSGDGMGEGPGSNGSSGAGDLQVTPNLGGAAASGSSGSQQVTCTAGHCTCSGSNTTTIEGYVYDPAGKNPLYNVSVYVPDPSSPLPNLDTVPLACGCSQLYPAKVLATGSPTDATGHFEIPCAPSGTVSLVVQTGKWRRQYDGIAVTANQPNTAPKLQLPASSAEGSLPNIAISTGGADSLECLPLRFGVASSEYVLGDATGGHIHIYTGYHGATMTQGSVDSYQTLWDQQAHLNEHDVVLLSCEGHETTGGAPGVPMNPMFQSYLMAYANAGGRVFASHYHYAWFNTGPFGTGANTLATWTTGSQTIDDSRSFAADIDTTLAGGAAFPEGSALGQWLSLVGALTANQLPIWFARNNVQALTQPPSTEWIHLAADVRQAPSATQYFSVDTPIGSGSAAVCGRIVYSDLHVSGGPGTNAPGVAPDYPTMPTQGGRRGFGGRGGGGGELQGGIVPSQCAAHALTPQEEALEFMLFDLSSCLVPIGQTTSPPPTIVK